MKNDVDLQDIKNLQKQIIDQPIIQLPTNHIPQGLIPREKLFDHNDVSFKPHLAETEVELEYFNLGTKKEPRYVKLSKILSEEIKIEYHKLFCEFVIFFA